MMKNTGRRTEFALGWEGQIFVKQAGWRTVVLHVTSEDTVGSLKARFRWSNSRLIKSPRELWDDTRSLGSYGVRKEDTLMLCGRLWGGGVCMGKPTVVAPGEDIAPQDASPAVEAPAAPTAPEEVASPAEDEAPRQKAEEEETAAQKAADVSVPASAPSPANAAAKKAAEEPPAAEAPAAPAAEEKAPEAVTAAEAPAPAAGARQARATGVVATENEVAQRHAKLCMDVSGLIRKGKFGGIALFDSTLEEQVGYMDATALRGMYAEHVMDAASSAAPFSPPNNPSLTCTPEGEFWYVVGKDGIDITKWEVKPGALPAKYEGCMVEGRNATPLSELLEADEAKRAKLRDTELIALRLYSGPMCYVYNNILRDIESGEASATANRYPTTIQLIVSGIRKLSTIAKMPDGGAVFRGLSALALPTEFFELDGQNCAGGVEASFMSTTQSEEVARKYSGVSEGREATIFCLLLAKIL